MSNDDFLVDDEFDHYLPRTSNLCDKALEVLIKDAGKAREPLVVWDEANILLDGHRRYRACKKLGLPYEVRRISCKDRDDAKQQMDMIQFSRRNMSDHDQALWSARNHKTLVESGMSSEVAASAIAEQQQQSERTVFRHVAYGKNFESLSDEWKQEVIRQKIPQKYVSAIASMSDANKSLLLSQVRKHGVAFLHDRARRIAKETAEKKEKMLKKNKIDVPEAARAKEIIVDVEGDKRQRVLQLLDIAERAVGASTREFYKLFGQKGLDNPHCEQKKRCDKAHRDLATVLAEVRAKYEN